MEIDAKELEQQWKKLLHTLEPIFGSDLDMQALLFLIGVQELGKGPRKFKKDQKLELMHIAICTLLQPYGFYRFIGRDEDGYPHWELKEQLPHLTSGHQLALMKSAIIAYFKENEILA